MDRSNGTTRVLPRGWRYSSLFPLTATTKAQAARAVEYQTY